MLTTSTAVADDGVRMDNRTLARVAVLAPIPAIVLEPITASAYFRTKDGKTSGDPSWISAWSDPLQRHLHGPFHLGLGRHGLPDLRQGVRAGLRRDARGGRADPAHRPGRWALRLGAQGRGRRVCARPAGDHRRVLEPVVRPSFIALSVPSILLLFILSPFLGAWMLRNRIGSRLGAWMVALTMLGIIGMTVLGGHLGFAVIYLSVGWMLQVRALPLN